MDWFEYSCCGYTFSRVLHPSGVDVICPRCRQLVKPLVSMRIKEDELRPEADGSA